MKTNYLILNWALELVNAEPKPKIDFAVGGQAVIEGVMMRSPNHVTIAVRKQDKSIKVNRRKYKALSAHHKIFNIPILRGVINLFEMMVIGTKALNWSASESIDEEMPENNGEKGVGMKIFEAFMMILSLVLALAISLALFKALPLALTTLLEKRIGLIEDYWILFNLIDGALKMIIFIGYIYILSLFPSFRRVFEYHGAEHKSIFTYEEKLPLKVENARKQSRFHPRCGTSFILIVFTISILIYTFVPKQDDFTANLIMRISFLPLIAGISYEYLKISAKYANRRFAKALVAPGLWFQRLTTKDPNDDQLEVGLRSLQEAVDQEK